MVMTSDRRHQYNVNLNRIVLVLYFTVKKIDVEVMVTWSQNEKHYPLVRTYFQTF
jgi:hypothetical protein